MAPRVSAEERANATLVLAGEGVPLDDVESAFEDWRGSFETSEQPGFIRAFQVPIDERGTVNVTSKTQIRLGAWPIDLYNFDELCSMIIRDFMLPAGEKIMAVRLLGTKSGERGLQFNKIVVLRPPGNSAPAQQAQENTSTLLKAFQEMNERTLAMIQRMQPPAKSESGMQEMMKFLTLAQAMNAPMQQMMQALIPALAGRPTPIANVDPMTQLSSVLEVVERLDGLRGNEGGGGDGDGLAAILKAVTPMAVPALQAIPALVSAASRPALAAPAPARPAGPAGTPLPKPTKPLQNFTQADISTEDQAMFAQLKPQIDALVQMAAQGSDAAASADLLFDQVLIELPDQFYDKAADLLTGENFIAQASVFNPAVRQHAEWFTAFRDRMVKRITDEDSAAGMTPTAPVTPT